MSKCVLCGDPAVLIHDGTLYCGRDYPMYNDAKKHERVKNGIDPRTGRRRVEDASSLMRPSGRRN